MKKGKGDFNQGQTRISYLFRDIFVPEWKK